MNTHSKLNIQEAPENLQNLFELAKLARSRSHSPYSKYKVGSAVRLNSGQTFGGCNVENASYGATVCAERVAIQKAVSETGGEIKITDVLVVTDSNPPWAPCGLCRQVIAEFAQNTQIHIANIAGEYLSISFAELFPSAFDRSQMK